MDRMVQRLEELSAHGARPKRPVQEMSYGELLQSMTQKLFTLASKERMLVQLELEDQIASEILLTRRLVIGACMIVVGICMLLVALILLCARFVAPWISAGILGLCVLGAGDALVVVTWRRHRTVDQIQSELKEKLAWSDKPRAADKPAA